MTAYIYTNTKNEYDGPEGPETRLYSAVPEWLVGTHQFAADCRELGLDVTSGGWWDDLPRDYGYREDAGLAQRAIDLFLSKYPEHGDAMARDRWGT